MLEDVDEVMEMMWIEEEEPPIDDKIQPIEIFAWSQLVTHFKGCEALHNIVLDIADWLLRSDVRTKVGQMWDELQQSFEMLHRNVNKLPLDVKQEKSCIRGKWLLHDMFKQ